MKNYIIILVVLILVAGCLGSNQTTKENTKLEPNKQIENTQEVNADINTPIYSEESIREEIEKESTSIEEKLTSIENSIDEEFLG